MSKQVDSGKLSESTKKRSSSTDQGSSPHSKRCKVDDCSGDKVDVSEKIESTAQKADAQDNGGDTKSREDDSPRCVSGTRGQVETAADTQDLSRKGDVDSSSAEQAGSNSDKCEPGGEAAEAASYYGDKECRPSTSEKRSDSAAIAAAEALASLTGGNKDKSGEEMPCSSKQATSSKDISKLGQQPEAAPADSSSSLLTRDDEEDAGDGDEDDSLPGSSSTPSSSLASDNDEDECAIVSVKMAPEIRQSIAHLAQVQTQLNTLEKKGARLYQRLELKLERQRRPHLDQRSAITHTIPGFWVTALLNHPYLSPHIDENDEDALSYMTNLEIESFKHNKLGYRIRFHFRRNPYFQNTVIMKELHLGMGGSPVSMSNPILWHRGQNLTGSAEQRRSTRGGYQSFFSWFSDHSCPGRDDIAQILKDDLYRNPLRYYLTPLWEPRENGSAPKPPASNNGDECVVISDSEDDDEPDESSQESRREERQTEEEEEDDDDEDEDEGGRVAGSEDRNADVGESSYEEKEEEEVDVEEMDESHDSGADEVRDREEEGEENVDVDEGGEGEEN
ncbi:testis specific protein Y-linked [Alosa sapidissima]|uniref:testis specific protein Y-linked n=1 Tax=Alosa sapidissima TaxID=34773 RepID=UPI001C07F3C1|nr:testis specific protein Y-linked [Alosa sapidissima]